jgi:CheY-like chemotaxis protein
MTTETSDRTKRKCILIVDDIETNLRLASDILDIHGYDVTTAADAEIAEAMLLDTGASLPDLILMDIALPGMDGLTLTRRLKSYDRTAHIPILALTASAMRGDDRRAIEAGCSGYITKPIDTRIFPQMVAGFLK